MAMTCELVVLEMIQLVVDQGMILYRVDKEVTLLMVVRITI
jgi:hypothetical protein